jgi:hypothetical protein
VSNTKAMCDTPLSDLIAAHIARGSSESWALFLDGFRKSQVCVIAVGGADWHGRRVRYPVCRKDAVRALPFLTVMCRAHKKE